MQQREKKVPDLKIKKECFNTYKDSTFGAHDDGEEAPKLPCQKQKLTQILIKDMQEFY